MSASMRHAAFAPRVDADVVVGYPQNKVLRVLELHAQSPPPRVQAGVEDRFVADAIDLVPDDRVHFSRVPDD